jgi:hypothetical protein
MIARLTAVSLAFLAQLAYGRVSPLSLPPHPRLLFSREGVEQLKQRMQRTP